MSVVVRSATASDIKTLVALNHVVQKIHVASEPDHFRSDFPDSEISAFFYKILKNNNSSILIADLNGTAVGYIWFDLQDKPETPFNPGRKQLYIQHIVIVENARRSGVASALMRAAEDEARERDVRFLVLDTWAFNEQAQRFFRAAGFTSSKVVMRKTLS